MATASSTTAAPVARLRGLGTVVGRALPATATVVGVAALLRVLYEPAFLNYDARYSLMWARDLSRGLVPDYLTAFAPTPHPFQTTFSFLALPFGDGADQVILTLALLSFGALVWLVYRLGVEIHSPWVGATAAIVVLTRPALERYALIGYQDLAFAALIVWCVLTETRSPRRGLPVLAALVVAGLMRPDAWVLSGLYALYLWPVTPPRRRAAFTAIALAAPVLWAAQDWLVTGNPLHSLQGTSALAEQKNRTNDILRAPYQAAWYFKLLLLAPLHLVVPIGLFFAWRHLRRAAVLVVAAAVITGVVVLQTVLGLPLITRYLATPSVLLTVLFALAVFGWRRLPRGRPRLLWAAVGGTSLGVTLGFLPGHAGNVERIETYVALSTKVYGDLRLVGEAPAVRERFADCGQTFSTIGHRPVPDLRYWLDAPPGSVGTVEGQVTRVGPLMLIPRDAPQVWRFYRERFSAVAPPAGYRPLYVNDSWRVYTAPGCGSGRLAEPPGGAASKPAPQDPSR